MNESAIQSQIRAFIEFVPTPAGLACIVGAVLFLIAMVSSERAKWIALILLLWVTSLSFVVRESDRRLMVLASPLNEIRSQSRPVSIAVLMGLLVPTVMSGRGWRIRAISGAALAYFVFQMIFTLRIVLAGVYDRGMLCALIYPLIFAVFGIGLARWIQTWEDARKAVIVLAGAGIVYLLGTCYQLARNPGAIIFGHRLFGTSGNPQFVGLLLGVTLPPMCYLAARPRGSKFWHFCLCGAIGFAIILLFWTGSRTGVLMTIVGVGLLFRARVGRLLGIGLIVAAFGLLAMQIYGESATAFTGMFQRGDSRTAVWSNMIAAFRDHIFWGAMENEFGVGESSYLATACNMGLFGLFFLLIPMLLAIVDMYRLQRIRRRLREESLLADLVVAGLVSIGTASVFEAILLGTLTIWVFAVYIYLALAAFLMDAAQYDPKAACELAVLRNGDDIAQDTVPQPYVDSIEARSF